ncbi:hypothetical protein [Vibrio crassostreae]|uniref:hypothetical protein n=1 Tax=Vibrio crassostreae TaxID=246167 RepID=UPI001B30419C|nr:hypothetical protein [Vibrio crassostreae]
MSKLIDLIQNKFDEKTMYESVDHRCGNFIIPTASDFDYACSVLVMNLNSFLKDKVGDLAIFRKVLRTESDIVGSKIVALDLSADTPNVATVDITEFSVSFKEEKMSDTEFKELVAEFY